MRGEPGSVNMTRSGRRADCKLAFRLINWTMPTPAPKLPSSTLPGNTLLTPSRVLLPLRALVTCTWGNDLKSRTGWQLNESSITWEKCVVWINLRHIYECWYNFSEQDHASILRIPNYYPLVKRVHQITKLFTQNNKLGWLGQSSKVNGLKGLRPCVLYTLWLRDRYLWGYHLRPI